jgi:hypothetical protein
MNERTINDLAVKSGLAEDMGRGYKFPDNYLDFAELIVRECLEQVFYTIEDEEQDNISSSIRDKIKQHFGVEE